MPLIAYSKHGRRDLMDDGPKTPSKEDRNSIAEKPHILSLKLPALSPLNINSANVSSNDDAASPSEFRRMLTSKKKKNFLSYF